MPGASGRKPASSTESSDAASSDAMAAYDALPRRVVHALDLVNFSLADVRDGLGPYLSV